MKLDILNCFNKLKKNINSHKEFVRLKNRISFVRKNNSYKPVTKPIVNSYSTNNGKFTSCLWQHDKHQDFLWESGTNFIVADGHGNNLVVDWLKNIVGIVLENILKADNPIKAMEENLKSQKINTLQSGACVTIVQTSEKKVDIFYVGDCKAQIYVNDSKVNETKIHTMENEDEIERLKLTSSVYRSEMMMAVLPSINGKSQFTTKMGQRVQHKSNCTYLQVTRCIGHAEQSCESITGTNIGHISSEFSDDDKILVIVGSDGIWDVLQEDEDLSSYTNSCDLTVKACNNWYNDFNFINPLSKKITNQKGLLSDDIAVYVWFRK